MKHPLRIPAADAGRLWLAAGLSLGIHAALLAGMASSRHPPTRLGGPVERWAERAIPRLEIVVVGESGTVARNGRGMGQGAASSLSGPAAISGGPRGGAAPREGCSRAAPAPGIPVPPSVVARVSGARFCPPPSYPEAARRSGAEGVVVLEVRANGLGCVESVVVHRSSGHDLLDRAACVAVRRWRLRVGEDIPHFLLPVRFRLDPKP